MVIERVRIGKLYSERVNAFARPNGVGPAKKRRPEKLGAPHCRQLLRLDGGEGLNRGFAQRGRQHVAILLVFQIRRLDFDELASDSQDRKSTRLNSSHRT